jgi:hypothetical protein
MRGRREGDGFDIEVDDKWRTKDSKFGMRREEESVQGRKRKRKK